MIRILDCTMRDGGESQNWNYTDEDVFKHLELLNSNNIDYCELGYRNSRDCEDKGRFYRCEVKEIEKFYNAKGNLLLGVMTDTKRYSELDFVGLEDDKIDFVRVAAHPEEIQKSLEIADSLLDKGYKVFIQLMDITNIDADGYLYLYMWDRKKELESIYLADSYSKVHPSDVGQYYNKLKVLGYQNISFHAHNQTGCALENSLVIINQGGYSVDTIFGGVGRNGGNLDYEDLKKYLQE